MYVRRTGSSLGSTRDEEGDQPRGRHRCLFYRDAVAKELMY